MALISCPECHRRVSDRATSCPGCGCPMTAALPTDSLPLAPLPPVAPSPAAPRKSHRPEPDDSDEREADSPQKAHRPWWVVLVCALYVVLVAAVTLGPVVLSLLFAAQYKADAGQNLLFAAVYALVVFGGGASLLVIPIRAWPDPSRRQRIVFPLIGSGLLAAVVFAGFGMAASELAASREVLWAVLVMIPVVWLLWAVVFWYVSRSTDPLTLNGRMYKSLLAGSVLEFLVAVPMHLIVRQRGDCCGGMYTGFGIGVGLVVAVLALGPAVLLLFYRRYKQAYSRRR